MLEQLYAYSLSMKRAGHFLSAPVLAYSPPNDAIVTALLGMGYEVDGRSARLRIGCVESQKNIKVVAYFYIESRHQSVSEMGQYE